MLVRVFVLCLEAASALRAVRWVAPQHVCAPQSRRPHPSMCIPDEPMVYAIPDEPMVFALPDDPSGDAPPAPGDPELVWLRPDARDDEARSLGESIGRGDVVLRVPNVADSSELGELLQAGLDACDQNAAPKSKNRFSVSDPVAFGHDVVLRCEEILLRILDWIDDAEPSVYEALFKPSAEWASRQPLTAQGLPRTVSPSLSLDETCPSLRELYMAGELEWSEGEPAINVYTADGRFGAHKDHMALTVLIPLSSPADFTGGGTGFWAKGQGGIPGFEIIDENKGAAIPDGPPEKVLRPSLGTALVFGGDLVHAGMPVESGVRSVFVASFSTRTAASPEDRVHGLQFDPSASALRQY